MDWQAEGARALSGSSRRTSREWVRALSLSIPPGKKSSRRKKETRTKTKKKREKKKLRRALRRLVAENEQGMGFALCTLEAKQIRTRAQSRALSLSTSPGKKSSRRKKETRNQKKQKEEEKNNDCGAHCACSSRRTSRECVSSVRRNMDEESSMKSPRSTRK